MFSNANQIIVLDSNNFDRSVLHDNQNVWFVMFYSAKCAHCRQVSVEFIKASIEMNGLVRFGVVEGENNKALMKRFNIDGYPTFLLFSVNKLTPIEYSGSRKASGFIKFCGAEIRNIRRRS